MRTVNWEAWPYLIQVLEALETHKEVIILKARQLGLSWLICAYCVWKAIFNDNVRVLMMSQGEEEAWDLISKCKFIWENLPDYLRPKSGHDSKALLDFTENKSEIKALPSTEKAGRSTDATIVVRDELETHLYAKENFVSIGPTVDSGGQLIELSTINKFNLNSHFQERYKQARTSENNAFPIFLGWKLRPVREEGMTVEDWFREKIQKKYKPWEVEQEYPATETEALAPPKVKAFFDRDALANMYQDVFNPIKSELSDKYKATVKVWKDPVPGQRYVIFADPSDGKEDPHAIVCMDWATQEMVACSHGKTPADFAAQIYHDMVLYYNKAYNCFEANALAGGKFGETVKNLGTPNIHKQDPKRLGWWSSRQSRRVMDWGLEEVVRHNVIRIHNRDCLNELEMIMIGDDGEPTCPNGGHDDWFVALGGVVQIRKSMPANVGKIISFRYKDS